MGLGGGGIAGNGQLEGRMKRGDETRKTSRSEGVLSLVVSEGFLQSVNGLKREGGRLFVQITVSENEKKRREIAWSAT